MRRYVTITVATAVAVIGGGVAFGSTQEGSPEPSPTSTPPVRESVRETCEQSREQIRQTYPDAVISECNSGESTLTTP